MRNSSSRRNHKDVQTTPRRDVLIFGESMNTISFFPFASVLTFSSGMLPSPVTLFRPVPRFLRLEGGAQKCPGQSFDAKSG